MCVAIPPKSPSRKPGDSSATERFEGPWRSATVGVSEDAFPPFRTCDHCLSSHLSTRTAAAAPRAPASRRELAFWIAHSAFWSIAFAASLAVA